MTTTFVREISLRYRGPKRGKTFNPMVSSLQAADFIRRVLPDNVREHFVVLFLDGQHKVCGFYIASTGSAASCPVTAREVFQPASIAGAVAILVAHNHPSGDVTPSAEDRSVTRCLVDAGQLLGIPVLDHVIIGGARHYSFSSTGELPSASLPNPYHGPGPS